MGPRSFLGSLDSWRRVFVVASEINEVVRALVVCGWHCKKGEGVDKKLERRGDGSFKLDHLTERVGM